MDQISTDTIAGDSPTLVDLLSMDDGDDIEFEPARLGLTIHIPDLTHDDDHTTRQNR